jgi:hypothetical protein
VGYAQAIIGEGMEERTRVRVKSRESPIMRSIIEQVSDPGPNIETHPLLEAFPERHASSVICQCLLLLAALRTFALYMASHLSRISNPLPSMNHM